MDEQKPKESVAVEPAEPAVTTEPQTPASTEPAVVKNNRLGLMIGGLVLLGLLGGAYYWLDSQDSKADNLDTSAVVAIVNGVEIPRSDFNENIERTNQIAVAQGADPSDSAVATQIKEQTLTTIVNTLLLIQAAGDSDTTVPEETIVEQRAVIEAQFGGEEAVAAELDRLGMTESDLVADIKEQLLVEAFISDAIDIDSIVVTEDEITAFYEQISQGGQDVPPLEEIGPQIEEQLLTQKQQEAAQELIDELRSNAEIEILI